MRMGIRELTILTLHRRIKHKRIITATRSYRSNTGGRPSLSHSIRVMLALISHPHSGPKIHFWIGLLYRLVCRYFSLSTSSHDAVSTPGIYLVRGNRICTCHSQRRRQSKTSGWCHMSLCGLDRYACKVINKLAKRL